MDVKAWYLSKTLWLQIIGAVVLIVGQFSPTLSAFLQSNFSAVGAGWAAVNFILRLFSKDQIG